MGYTPAARTGLACLNVSRRLESVPLHHFSPGSDLDAHWAVGSMSNLYFAFGHDIASATGWQAIPAISRA